MSIRETMNRHPGLTTLAMIPVIALAIGIAIWWQLPEKPAKVQTQSFFTVDDGKTWFADDMNKVPPFDKDGKQAVAAFVFRCGSGQPFVGYLESLTPEAKKKVTEIMKEGVNRGNAPQLGMTRGMGVQRKKPGDTEWVKITDPGKTFEEIKSVTCKDGKTPVEVSPDIP